MPPARCPLQGVAHTFTVTCAPQHVHVFCLQHAINVDTNWERAHFAYAVYLDQLYRDAKARQVGLGVWCWMWALTIIACSL